MKQNALRVLVYVFCFSIFSLATSSEAQACNCMKLTAKYNKLSNKLAAADAAGEAMKAQNLKDRIINLVKNNWKEMPDCPPPVLPADWCPPDDGGGGKRDGKKGRVGPGAEIVIGTHTGTDTVILNLFLRNSDPVDIEIVQLELRSIAPIPVGMELIDTFLSGVVIPPLSPTGDVLVPIRVAVTGPLPTGTTLQIGGEVIGPNGTWPDTISLKVSTSDVLVETLTPIAPIPPTGTVAMTWRIHNPNPFPVVKSYGFVGVPDPMGYTELNNGTPYAIWNSYPLDKSFSGGSVVIPPFDFVDITKEHVSNEICEPTMLGCCALQLDGGLSCIQNPNEAGTPFGPALTAAGLDLLGIASGGLVRVIMTGPTGLFVSEVPTLPLQPVDQIIDQLVWDIHNQYQSVPNFPYQAVALDNFIDVFGPPGGAINFQSLDPGLNFGPAPCESPGWNHAEIIAGDVARLSWFPQPDATEYLLQLVTPSGPPLDFLVPAPVTEFLTPPLAIGEYSWRIASNCGFGESALSAYSYPDTFQVNPCNGGVAPENLLTTLLPTRVRMEWDPVPNTTACQVRGTRVSPPGPTKTQNLFGLEPTTTQVPYSLLGAGTGWEWRVRCACNTSPVNATPFSATESFTVPVARSAAEWTDVSVYPNPAQDVLSISGLPASKTGHRIRLSDLNGRVLLDTEFRSSDRAEIFSIDLKGWSDGIYLLQLDGTKQHLVHILR